MTKYVWRQGSGWHDKATGKRMVVPKGKLAVPMVTPTMPEYASPIDGRMIATRHDRREDMKRNDCVEAGDAGLSPTGGKIRNKRFAAKHGLTVSEEYR